MIDVILFFNRVWELVVYIIIWLAVQVAIAKYRYYKIDKNMREGRGYIPTDQP